MRPDLQQENEYYQQCLLDPILGKAAREYLFQRGIGMEAIKKWEIGWSPVGCTPPNFDVKEEYKVWKKMWGGITFPIKDQNGVYISISRRKVIDCGGPKYDHYPFPARRILFGLYQNKQDIQLKDRVIITEGQLDVISSWQKGLRIVTSSFGAHCSLDHFAVAARYATKIDILYDQDNAGKIGTDAVLDFTTWGDLDVSLKKNIFPQGEDLDTWIRNHSAEELFTLIDKDKTDYLKKKLMMLKRR
jgi:DNA primase